MWGLGGTRTSCGATSWRDLETMMLWALFTAGAISMILQPFVIKLLRARAVLDHPSERSSHETPTPRGGGVAVILGVLVALAFVVDAPWPATAGIAVMALLGLLDDVLGVPVAIRLAAQLILALTCGVLLAADLGMAGIAPGLLIGVWVVFFVNAFNFMDGINGISALQTIATGLVLGLAGVLAAEPIVAGWALALLGAAAGFLPFNLLRARVFLGDVGSYGLGAAIALLLVVAVDSGVPTWVVAAVILVDVVDVVVTVLARGRLRQPLLSAHRAHVYQRLVAAGRSHVAVAGGVATLSLTLGLGAVLAWRTASTVVTIVVGVLAGGLTVGYLIAPRLARSTGSRSTATSR